MSFSQQAIGYHVLRFGLAAMFLWFGFYQLTDTVNWVGWVPARATALTGLSPEMIVYLNGSLEILGGLLLASGFLIRIAAIILGLHLALIAYEIGWNDIGIRDFGLMTAVFSLYFFADERPRQQAVL